MSLYTDSLVQNYHISNSSVWEIDQSHKSHNAPVPYPTKDHFGTEMYTFMFHCHALWDMGQVHCGICEIGLFQWAGAIAMQLQYISNKVEGF